ncbi:unnamed protein product [Clonostachys rhizophaga]|uniref:Alpha/beta hydrolase fold-3 domain-containing protein n=1 Tax=Clonostachys rhizophaga TaxID=160324 RepID=A0A9N9VDI1_9HYPO|nr:unnamed protein product [Clonostachys rhizophaga]
MVREYSDTWLEFEKGLGGARPVLSGTPEEMRVQYRALGDALEQSWPAIPETVVVVDDKVSQIKLRIFMPPHSGGPAPLGVYYHGGGLVIGPSKGDDVLCGTLAHATGSIIVSVCYRLSPEHKSPVHLHDAIEAFKWAFDNAARLGADATKLFTFGSSSGGMLALATARQIRLSRTGLPSHAVKGVVALCPVTIHPEAVFRPPEHRSLEENATGIPLVDKAALVTFSNAAGLHPTDLDYFTLLDRDSHKLFPPTYIATCEFDPLRDDGIVLEEYLRLAGVPIKRDHYDNMPHVFFNVPTLPETFGIFMENTIRGIEWVISQL